MVLTVVVALKLLMVALVALALVNYGRRREGRAPLGAGLARPPFGAAAVAAVLLALGLG